MKEQDYVVDVFNKHRAYLRTKRFGNIEAAKEYVKTMATSRLWRIWKRTSVKVCETLSNKEKQ